MSPSEMSEAIARPVTARPMAWSPVCGLAERFDALLELPELPVLPVLPVLLVVPLVEKVVRAS